MLHWSRLLLNCNWHAIIGMFSWRYSTPNISSQNIKYNPIIIPPSFQYFTTVFAKINLLFCRGHKYKKGLELSNSLLSLFLPPAPFPCPPTAPILSEIYLKLAQSPPVHLTVPSRSVWGYLPRIEINPQIVIIPFLLPWQGLGTIVSRPAVQCWVYKCSSN